MSITATRGEQVLRPRPVALFALLAVLLAGCRLGVRAEVDVERDGTGTAGVVLHLDAALLDELDELGVDPTAELSAAAANVPSWQLTRRGADDGSLTVSLVREISTPDGFADAFAELVEGLADTDPALLVDVEVDVDDAGAATVSGTALLRAPAGPGLLLDDPAARTAFAEEVEGAVDASLVVGLPGPIERHDADELDGSTLTWQLPVGEQRTVSAAAAPPPWWAGTGWLIPAAVLLLVLSLAALVWVVVRRRVRGRDPAGADPDAA
jgi:hypothetical protein